MNATLSIVIVEDCEADAVLIARALTKSGLRYTLHRVQTEPAFVHALSELAPQLIISDFSLPEFDGLRALEIARKLAPQVPFVFVSGTIGEERAINALQRGATDYVLKSNLSRLSPAVERALREVKLKADRRKAEQQRREQDVRLQRLTRSYRMLSSTGSAILRLHNRSELLNELCRIAVKQGGYDRVVISIVDPDAKVLRPRAQAGGHIEPLIGVDHAVLSDPGSPSVTSRVIHNGAAAVYNDLAGGGAPPPHRDSLLRCGFHAFAALPLLIDDTAVGTMSLCSRQTGVFDEAEVRVLQELTANLSFALQYLEKDEAVQFLSHFDSLTGLAKRPLFCQRLARALTEDSISGRSRTVIVFDVQKLGSVNDSLGRHVGDRLIERIARRLKESYSDTESTAYLAGGTFALTIPQAGNTQDTGRFQQNAATKLFSEPFNIDGHELHPAIRSGVAFYPHDGDSADSLVQSAEAALKAAREDNEQYLAYGLIRQRPTSKSLALEARLNGALDREEFLLHYQPKIDIPTGRITGLEALLRWQDSIEGLVSPAVFIPLLERSGAMVDVGAWVVRQAVRDTGAWSAGGIGGIRVAVNVSAVQLRRRDFVKSVLDSIASATGGNSARLDIEITESMLMSDIELIIKKLDQLRAAGVGIAIDDFGTGYSSLCLLSRLPADTLKIDRSFVQNITDTPRELALLSTIASLARALNMLTVAEGVETAEQLDLLREIQCDEAQGYYLARPMPALEVPRFISASGRQDPDLVPAEPRPRERSPDGPPSHEIPLRGPAPRMPAFEEPGPSSPAFHELSLGRRR